MTTSQFIFSLLTIVLFVNLAILVAMWIALPVILYVQLRKINEGLTQMLRK